MANYETLKGTIRSVIRENGNNEITGNLLQQSLIAMIASLGAQYLYAGIATPATNPGTPDQNVFFIAAVPGAYANFGGIVVNDDEVAILKYNGTWTKDVTGIVTAKTVKDILDAGYLFKGTAEPEMDPGTPDVKVFYFASQPGIYSDFGGEVVYDGEVAVLYHDGSGWKKMTTGIASKEALDVLRQNTEVRSEFELSEYGYQESMRFNWDGRVQSLVTDVCSLLKFRVEGGKQYAFSGRMSATFNLYFLAWYDENENFIYKEPYRGSRDRMVTYNKQLVVAPENAAYAYMNVNKIFRSYYKLYYIEPMSAQEIYKNTVLKTNVVDSLESTATDAPLSANKGRELKEYIDAEAFVDTYQPHPLDALIENTAYFGPDDVRTTTLWSVKQYAVNPGQKYYLCGYMRASYTLYFLYWFKQNGEYIAREPYKGSSTEEVVISFQEVTAPQEAAYARLNAFNVYAINTALYDKTSFDSQQEFDMQEKVNTLFGYKFGTIKSFPFYMGSDGSFTEHHIYQSLAIRVYPGEQYVLNNTDNMSVLRYAFATTDQCEVNTPVPVVAGTSVSRIPVSGVTVTIPEGCSYLIVNYADYKNEGRATFDVKKVTGGGGTSQRKKLRVLCIGNSYSQDALAYVPFIMQNMNVDVDVTIGILMMSSSVISDHINNFENQTEAYTYYHYAAGASSWSNLGRKTIQYALENYEWDIIITHSVGASETNPAVYLPQVNRLVNDIYTDITYPVKFAWMPGQIRAAVTNGGANRSEDTIMNFYNNLVGQTEQILDNTVFEFSIPVGTSVQNARTLTVLKTIGDYANNVNNTSGFGYLEATDGVHLQEGLPCQLAAYTVILSLLDVLGMGYISINGESTRATSAWTSGKSIPSPHGTPVGATDDNCRMAQMCAIMAHKHPYDVTDMNDIVNPS